MANKVLVIISSMIEEKNSFSNALVKHFVKHYQESHPEDEINYLNLNDVAMASKTLTTHNFNTFFNEEDSDKYINQLKSINKVIFSSPMTNYNVTSMAKNYLDHILVADKTFSYKYSKKGDAVGLLTNLKVQILATQGAPYGWYLWGNHAKYLEGTWKFAGAEIAPSVLVCGTKVQDAHEDDVKLRIGEQDLEKGDSLPNLGPEKTMEKFEQHIKKAAQEF
ncbi:FMN-dependent NADH-azoreductase [Spiroplasma platyhelix]|uniref:FMN dependent NADH:quinone oxidoreductase n=1 Tax=Spiroplasma platyhelix PALS-1 TaxID=1276218 RepID=A0A846TQG0_9MOLU|nr:FMN-dependent NADH-azoreductase [Spiroplasma platyhelix]MBE4704187.1 FMN-dependent NADH-azoreductase [Spiroplasma platyhelix PALS-1]NKE38560.1 FMN-dependent NADH-azoreductase [Spiroplasma platyhelix PALS-1]UJB28771.1 azoreductase [Spiroplasma platyhelix PALS-1]